MSPSSSAEPGPLLFRRKGGGGGGGKGGGGRSSGSKSGGSKSKGISISSAFGSKASTSSKGGGKKFKIASGPFSGREAGGGTRSTVYGGAYYGSGYPYGATGWYVGPRPFPYVFWPVYIYPTNSYDSSLYGPSDNASRPGGVQYAATVQSPSNLTVTYRILGDRDSVTSVTESLITACKMIRPIPYAYKPGPNDTNDSRPKPEQVIQYYRASSFVLSLDGYNNTFALPGNAPNSSNEGPKNTTMVPLPNIVDKTFLQCVNSTIGNQIPLIQPGGGISSAAIGGIVIGGLFFVVLLYLCCKAFWFASIVAGIRALWKKLTRRKQKQQYGNIEEANSDTKHHEEQPNAAGYIVLPFPESRRDSESTEKGSAPHTPGHNAPAFPEPHREHRDSESTEKGRTSPPPKH